MWVSAVVENYLVFQRLIQKFPGQSENRYSSLNSGIKELKKKICAIPKRSYYS